MHHQLYQGEFLPVSLSKFLTLSGIASSAIISLKTFVQRRERALYVLPGAPIIHPTHQHMGIDNFL